MKRKSWFHKIVFTINAVFAFLLLIACVVPYIALKTLSFLSFLSLAVPFLVVVNGLFLLYWAVRRKKQLWYSLVTLVFSYFILGTFIKLNFSKEEILEEDLSVMTYNVRGFNKYKALDNPSVFEDVKDLINAESPDVVCFQEVSFERRKEYTAYPHQFLKYIYDNNESGKVLLGIFSKYPILNSEIIHFPNTANNAAYADILYKNDTIRVYNLHLQSYQVIPNPKALQMEDKGKLFKRLDKTFQKQQEQVEIINEHGSSVPYKKIICGDFNNTQFSNTYHQLKGEMQDSFIEKGNGFGKTYSFIGIPLRIDFILADKSTISAIIWINNAMPKILVFLKNKNKKYIKIAQ